MLPAFVRPAFVRPAFVRRIRRRPLLLCTLLAGALHAGVMLAVLPAPAGRTPAAESGSVVRIRWIETAPAARPEGAPPSTTIAVAIAIAQVTEPAAVAVRPRPQRPVSLSSTTEDAHAASSVELTADTLTTTVGPVTIPFPDAPLPGGLLAFVAQLSTDGEGRVTRVDIEDSANVPSPFVQAVDRAFIDAVVSRDATQRLQGQQRWCIEVAFEDGAPARWRGVSAPRSDLPGCAALGS